MDDVTDTVFRRVIASCAKPDLFFTEFVSVDGLASGGRQAVIRKLDFSPSEESPIIAQLWGLNPDNFYQAAKQISKMGFAGVDLNMGCPVRTIIKNGACSALINNRDLAKQIIEATIAGAGSLPVSIKTRLGFDNIDSSWHQFLLGFKIAALSIHGRTVKELSKVPNHWEEIAKITKMRDVINKDIHIIGNGDVSSRALGLELARTHNLDGIMIGRGVFHDPYIFAEASPWASMPQKDKLALYKKHILLFRETWGDTRSPLILKKFAKVYVSGFSGASRLRVELMKQQTIAGMLKLL